MNINTANFGQVSYSPKDIIHIPDGLFGFEDMTEYLLIHIHPEESTFLCLQSLQDENLSFILANPTILYPDYAPVLKPEDQKRLGLKEDTPVIFYSICVLKKPLKDSSCNLKAPILIKTDSREGAQVILENREYDFHQPFPVNQPDSEERRNP